MHWCNGFSTTLTLRCKAWGPGRCYAASRAPGGRWRLLVGDGTWLRGELCAAWLAGPLAGLAFRGADGARYRALVPAAAQSAENWRRFRVQLRVLRI